MSIIGFQEKEIIDIPYLPTMKFRTQIPAERSGVAISHQHPILCLGSCFAEHIGMRLKQFKFPVLVNPFGIIYNPVSIVEGMEKVLSGNDFTENNLFENHGLWHSYAHHGKFSHPNKLTALENMNRSLAEVRLFIEKTNRLILTLGTANVFVLKENNTVVANCHKMPGHIFDRRRLSVEEVAVPIISILQKLKAKTPDLEVVVTVSPVRHLRDGLVENQRSKATLVLGLESVCQALSFVHYFPSYEIMLDDLRDYRFYENDLSHPNEMAIDYIWEYFENAFFNEKTKTLSQQVAQVVAAAEHRAFHPASTAHQAFLRKQIAVIEKLEEAHLGLDFTKEKGLFEKGLLP